MSVNNLHTLSLFYMLQPIPLCISFPHRGGGEVRILFLILWKTPCPRRQRPRGTGYESVELGSCMPYSICILGCMFSTFIPHMLPPSPCFGTTAELRGRPTDIVSQACSSLGSLRSFMLHMKRHGDKGIVARPESVNGVALNGSVG